MNPPLSSPAPTPSPLSCGDETGVPWPPWHLLFAATDKAIALFRARRPREGGPLFRLEAANPAFLRAEKIDPAVPEPIALARLASLLEPDWLALLQQAATTGASATAEDAHPPEGRSRLLRVLPYAPGRFAFYLTDTTERQIMERRMLTAQRLENVGLLVSGITHDLSNLLSPGRTAAFMLKRRHKEPEDIKLINLLEDAHHKASNMISQLMRSVRVSEGPDILYPAQATAEIVEILRVTLPPTIRIESTIAQRLAPAAISPTHFNQVLLNLAINARDAMPDGGTLSLRVQEVEVSPTSPGAEVPTAGRYILITVADSGCGIPPENLDQVFEPFFTTKGPDLGTGLGLPQVRALVERTGGVVRLSSAPGQGTEFRLYFPALHGDAAVDIPEEMDPATPLAGDMQRILIVEDYVGLRETMSLLLEANGFEPIVAVDGHEALKLLHQLDPPPALLLVDLSMPRTNGEDLIRQLRADGNTTPAIVMTAHAMGDELAATEARLQALGVKAVMRKPLREPLLLQMISAALTGGPAPITNPNP